MVAGITAALAYTTPYEVAYIATHAGGAGAVTVNIDATVGGGTPNLDTDTVAGSSIREFVANDMSTALPYANQAAVLAALGIGAATAAQRHGQIMLTNISGTNAGKHFFVIGNVTGGVPNKMRVTVGAAVDGVALVRIKRLHSIGR